MMLLEETKINQFLKSILGLQYVPVYNTYLHLRLKIDKKYVCTKDKAKIFLNRKHAVALE